jgi:hypothetical protein
MMIKKFILLIAAAGLLWHCSNSSSNKPDAAPADQTVNTTKAATAKKSEKIEKNASVIPVIKEVIYENEAQISAAEPLKVIAATDPETVDEIRYRWFVNDKHIEIADGDTLEAEHFKVKDWVHCRVTAVVDGKPSREFFTVHIRIPNQPPVFDLQPFEALEVPGTFYYTIQAKDPDYPDSNPQPLTFELLSPLDAGITLDKQSGELQWLIRTEYIEKLGKKIEIKFRATDEDQGQTDASIILNLGEAGTESY